MSDNSETVEDTKKGSLAEVTDDSYAVKFIEIVPACDDYHNLKFIDPVVAIKSEDMQDAIQEPADMNENEHSDYSVKQEPADTYEVEGPCFTVKVSSAFPEHICY